MYKTYNSKYLTLSRKIRLFRVFAECIFLYNCELWTTTKTINDNNKTLDSFHRRQFRYALVIKYPRVITNQKLYDITHYEPLGIVTERRRLSWLRHMMRVNTETPARQYFSEEEAWQSPDDMDINYSTNLTKRGIIHKSA